jgi:hypothetical protein
MPRYHSMTDAMRRRLYYERTQALVCAIVKSARDHRSSAAHNGGWADGTACTPEMKTLEMLLVELGLIGEGNGI